MKDWMREERRRGRDINRHRLKWQFRMEPCETFEIVTLVVITLMAIMVSGH